MPVEYGSVTPRAAAVATAASAALPPALRTVIPTWLATASTDDTAPPPPRMTGTLGRDGVTGLGPWEWWAVAEAPAGPLITRAGEPAAAPPRTRTRRRVIPRRYDRIEPF